MEKQYLPSLESLSTAFAWESAVSALTVVVASHQPELVERLGGEPLEEGAQIYYLMRAERLSRTYRFSKVEMLTETINKVVEAMDEHKVGGFVQLPGVFNDVWPQLADPERALSTPVQFS